MNYNVCWGLYMNCKCSSSDFITCLLSSVDRPINFLLDEIPSQTKVNSFVSYKDLQARSLSEQYDSFAIEKINRKKRLLMIKSIIFIVVISLVSSFISTAIQIDFSAINPTWYILLTCEMTLCPSLAVLIWKIRFQRLAKRDGLLQNMSSISLDLKASEIVNDTAKFKDKYLAFMNESFVETDKSGNYLETIQSSDNPRMCFYELSSKQSKIFSPLSENLAVEIILFLATLAVSLVTFILDLMNNVNVSRSLIISDCLTLAFALCVGVATGLFIAKRSHEKAVEISVIRYLFYSYLTDAK